MCVRVVCVCVCVCVRACVRASVHACVCVYGQFQRYSRYIFSVFYFHQATIKHLVDQSNKFKAYDDLGVQFYITT